MPLIKRCIEPVNISRVHVGDEKNELECVTNHTLANVIRQLSSLSRHAEDMFGELLTEAGRFYHRANRLQDRVDRLKVKVTQLDSTVEEVSLQDINMRKPFRSSIIKDQQVIKVESRPHAISTIYQHCDEPPPLQKLNKFREDRKDSMKFYTDPSYFFELWRNEMERDAAEMQRRKKGHRRKQPKRQAETRQIREIRNRNEEIQNQRMGKEFVQDLDPSVRKRTTSEKRSPSRPNSLELQNNMVPPMNGPEGNSRSASQQQYLQQQQLKQQDSMYGRANGPVHTGPANPAYMANNASHYHEPPAYSHNQHGHHAEPMQGQFNSTEQAKQVHDHSPALTPTKRGPGPQRNVSIVSSPRPSQPPPAPPGAMGNKSGNSSRESLPPPPPPPSEQMAQMNMRTNSPIHLVNPPAGQRDSPLRQREISQSPLQAHTTKSSTPDSMDLPPPPPSPTDTQTPGTPSSMASMPPPPPTPPLHDLHNGGAPPPPPPPPLPVAGNELVMKQNGPDHLPNGTIPSAVPPGLVAPQQDDVSVLSSTSSATGSSGSTLPVEEAVRDERSDLLYAIREGIKLRKVERQQKDEQRRHTASSHLDVQSIMEQAFENRRRALEANDSEEEEDDDEPDGEWSDEG